MNDARFVMTNETCTTLDLEGYRIFAEGRVEHEYDKDDSDDKHRQPSSAVAEFGVVKTVAARLKKAVQ